MVFTASLLDAQHNRNSVENKPVNLLVCPWARHLTECLHLYVADRWWGQVVHPMLWPSLTEDSQTEPERLRSVCTSSGIIFRTNCSNDEAV